MHPYSDLDARAFWARSVADRNMFDIDQLWVPKYNIRKKQPIATFGSCFAQHIGRAFESRGYARLNTEPAPEGLSAQDAKDYNYDIFTCRTGNIYTASLLKQWTEWALGLTQPPDEIWEKDGRYYDPFRPRIEPNGFADANELRAARDHTIKAFRDAIEKSVVFVFTLGLTESWFHKTDGHEYPMCPGTAAGTFDAAEHVFVNQKHLFVLKALREAIALMRGINPKLRILLTVSPVPLAATNSGKHVLVATMESKAILRAVAGQLEASANYIDYFPSFEIISAPPYRGAFFDPNQRNVNPVGVNHVMDCFFKCLTGTFSANSEAPASTSANTAAFVAPETPISADDVVCEEELLAAFGNDKAG